MAGATDGCGTQAVPLASGEAIKRIASLEACLSAMTHHATSGAGYLAPDHPDVKWARELLGR